MLFWQEVDQKRNQIKLHVKKFTGRKKCFFEIIAFQLNTALIPKPTRPVRGNRMRESCRITWAWANYQHRFHLIHKQIKGDEDFHSVRGAAQGLKTSRTSVKTFTHFNYLSCRQKEWKTRFSSALWGLLGPGANHEPPR